MKRIIRKVSIVSNRIETIDFKSFCEGGSPEYVAAKKKLKDLYLNHQISVNIRPSNIENEKLRSLTAYSLYINPLAFFDVHFMIAAGCVVLVAVLEKKLADNGVIGIAAALSGILRVALPVVAFGSVIYLISQLGAFI